MKKIIVSIFALSLILLSACKKENNIILPPTTPVQNEPEMQYINLNERTVQYGTAPAILDVNSDAAYDLLFSVVLVGDPLYAVDKYKFIVLSSIYTYLPVNSNEQIPVLNKNEAIPLTNFNGYNWYSASEITLVQKNIYASGNIEWVGHWLGATKRYVPFQIEKNNKRYNGWVELTEDKTNERIILHRAALSKEAEKNIKAGL